MKLQFHVIEDLPMMLFIWLLEVDVTENQHIAFYSSLQWFAKMFNNSMESHLQ